MLIVVEGPDLAGKTTFIEKHLIPTIKRYAPRDEIEVLTKGPAVKTAMDEYETPLLDYRPGRGKTIICSRWHWGEMVYPSIVGRESRITKADFWHIKQFLDARGVAYLYMTASTDELLRRWDRRGDDYIKREWLPAVATGFDEVRGLTSHDVTTHISISLPNLEKTIADDVVRNAIENEVNALNLNSFVTYAGPRHPDILLLGDVRGVKGVPQDARQPAFQSRKNSSGFFLCDIIARLMPRYIGDEIGVANACDVDNPLLLWERLDKPRVVTLGIQAYNKMREWNLPHLERVQHPQFVRRFKSSNKEAYAKEILKAAGY